MKRTISDTFWNETRWRVALQLILWGARIAPPGDLRDRLVRAYLAWSDTIQDPHTDKGEG